MNQIRYMTTEMEADEYKEILETLRQECDMLVQIGSASTNSGELKFDADNTVTVSGIHGLYFRNKSGYQHLRFRLTGNLIKQLNEMFEFSLLEEDASIMVSFLTYNEATGETKQLAILNPVAMFGIPLSGNEESEYTVSYLFEDLLYGIESLDVVEVENELEAEEAERELEEAIEKRRLQKRNQDLDDLGLSATFEEDEL